jgi:hypothetical protein
MKFLVEFIIISGLLMVATVYTHGVWTHSMNTEKGFELAQWAIDNHLIQDYTKLDGKHKVMNVRNMYMHTSNGINYKFTAEILVEGSEVKKIISSINFLKVLNINSEFIL